MKTRVYYETIFLVLSLLFNISVQAAQEPNPLYVEARSLWQQMSASSIPNDTKAKFGKRFGDLAQVQKQLWSLAGQVDSGACTDQCLDNYNSRVMAWQSNLKSFNIDARAALEANKCGLPALRACHSICGGEYGSFCFYGDVCNPMTHNCEHAAP